MIVCRPLAAAVAHRTTDGAAEVRYNETCFLFILRRKPDGMFPQLPTLITGKELLMGGPDGTTGPGKGVGLS